MSHAPLGRGGCATVTLVDGLTRTRIVQYAGASGDFNPVHTDEIYAVEAAGLSSVMAHGMLTMGMTGEVLAQAVDPLRIRSFGGRFTAPVWPGDVLIVSLSRSAPPADDVIDVKVAKDTGEVVFTGSAGLV